ncbi:MAG: inositol-3-phosphate synthase [Syntrophobacteraceae bacterium]
MQNTRTGIYLIGALGSISITVVAGALALRKKLSPPIGMVTSTDIFEGIDLVQTEDLVFGGCDIRRPEANCRDIFEKIAPVHPGILIEIKDELIEYQQEIDAGCSRNCGEAIERLACEQQQAQTSLRDEIACIRGLLQQFRKKNSLDRVIVVNLASTEPPLRVGACHQERAGLEACLDGNDKEKVRASTLYAYAAIQEGFPYINFTPSNAALIPAIIEMAEGMAVPIMGNDGKTGETLVKSALAPMFAYRNLEVMSWGGFNILGNMDGQVLNHPSNKESKIKTKDQVLSKILGYSPHTTVSIDYVPSLDDQKTAWDFIHFRGFLGAKMSLQFIWQGYDSILAAPLVLDMVRLAELANRRGEAGLMPHLGSFFKAPLGVEMHALPDQFGMLLDYAAGVKAAPSARSKV